MFACPNHLDATCAINTPCTRMACNLERPAVRLSVQDAHGPMQQRPCNRKSDLRARTRVLTLVETVGGLFADPEQLRAAEYQDSAEGQCAKRGVRRWNGPHHNRGLGHSTCAHAVCVCACVCVYVFASVSTCMCAHKALPPTCHSCFCHTVYQPCGM